jgi:hypothetical protein
VWIMRKLTSLLLLHTAIYYFFREYAERLSESGEYDGRYDDLMFYFALFHRQIFSRYNQEQKTEEKTLGKAEESAAEEGAPSKRPRIDSS